MAQELPNFYPEGKFDTANLRNSTLIIPSVSLANLPQLCIDLVISSLGLKRVGWIGTGDTVAPFAGLGDQGEIVTGGLEVYGSVERKLFVIQQRAPTLKAKKDEHVSLIKSFIEDQSFSFVLVLTSLDAANQDDAQLLTPHQQIIPPTSPSSPSPSSTTSPIPARLKSLPPLSLTLESDYPSPLFKPANNQRPYPPFLPSAGLARRLLSALQSTSVPHGCLTVWCVEGDNRGDAYGLTARVLQLLDYNGVAPIEPKSWKGLFGTEQGWSGGLGDDSEIYG